VSGVFGEKVMLGQANGPDVELVVSGSELYATYETAAGFPALYDDALGLFCYARVVLGSYESTGVPVTAPPPPGLEQHAKESDPIRAEKIRRREASMERRSANPTARGVDR
jgi:hypothetical protein